MSIIVFGGAGFIGSVLIKRLLLTNEHIIVIDNLSLGSKSNLDLDKVSFHHLDINDVELVIKTLEKEKVSEVWHLAANSDIPAGVSDISVDLNDTFLTTISVLKIMKALSCKNIYFASSSAIYGNHQARLHEDIGPLLPISNYGAMKLASEAALSAAQESYLDKTCIFRFPNVVGVPATHGVILDFIKRLKEAPAQLSVLGNGTQQKIYLHVEELVDAMLFIVENSKDSLNYFNIGPPDDGVTVKTIAEETVKCIAPSADIKYQKNDRGWVGDVPKFKYSVQKLSDLGWSPSKTSTETIIKAIGEIAEQEK